jgi:hypothetical protein
MRVGKFVQAVKCERVEGRQPVSILGDEVSDVGGARFNPGNICLIKWQPNSRFKSKCHIKKKQSTSYLLLCGRFFLATMLIGNQVGE